MRPIILYCNETSPPCRAVRLLGKILDLEFEIREIDCRRGDTKTEEYLKMNPQHQIPVINDNGFILMESRAILEYLAEAYGKDDSLLPSDVKAKATVHARVHLELGTLYPRFLMTYIHPRYFGKEVSPDNIKLLNETLSILDHYLSLTKWVATDHMTIADISLVVLIASIENSGHDLSSYKNISRWYEEWKKIPQYEAMAVK